MLLLQITLAKHDQKTMDANMGYIRTYFPLREGEDEYGGHRFLKPLTNEEEWMMTFKLAKDPEWNQLGWLSLHKEGGMIALYEILPGPLPPLTFERAALALHEITAHLEVTDTKMTILARLKQIEEYLINFVPWQCVTCGKVCCEECSSLFGEKLYCNECRD